MSACCCMGPQNGQPLCPCMMRNVTTINGRYVTVTDLGPISGIGEPSVFPTIEQFTPYVWNGPKC